jgi:hypothetical protein
MSGFSRSIAVRATLVALTIACGDASGPPSNPPASILVVSGDLQKAIQVGAKLPLPLTVKVLDAKEKPVPRTTVTWTTNTGALSATTTLTDGGGLASVEWTVGTSSGAQTTTAKAGGKTVVFTELVAAGPPAQITLSRDTVRLLGIGDFFRLNARAADQYGNTVNDATTVESADPSVVTADNFGSGAILTALASDKTTTLRVTAGEIVKTGTVIVLPPPCQSAAAGFTLNVGELGSLSGADASEFCVKGTAEGAEFIAIPSYADFGAGLLRLSISAGGTTVGASSTRVIPPAFQVNPGWRPRLQPDEAFELRLRERSIEELTPLIANARHAKASSGARFNTQQSTPQIGDLLKLNTNSSSACANAFVRTGRVAAISDHAILVADTANPANGFTEDDYRNFGVAFDTLVYPVDTLNFGVPTDVDANNHVILFFTRAVNELTPPQQGYYVGGFFFSRDLFPVTGSGSVAGCVGSNFAEMFYMLVPDPAGAVNQNVRTVDFVRSVTLGTLAHEFQHLINAGRRLYLNTGSIGFEESFLDEGLAHVAEELVFFRSSGLSPGQNISYEQIQASPVLQNAFDSFAAANFRRYREYLTNPMLNSPLAPNSNITTRGAIWSFLRYAADRRGGDQRQFWFQLVNPTADLRGLSNLTHSVTQDLAGWTRDWSIANYADDFVPGIQDAYKHQSWNVRTVVAPLNQGNWALATVPLDSVNTNFVSLNDGGAVYLRFGVAPGKVGGGRLTSRGGIPPNSFTISILRTK